MSKSSTAMSVFRLSVSSAIDLSRADNLQSTEFEINREYVGRIVGSQGAAVNKLRDSLGVKVDFIDDGDDKREETSKKKKAPVQKAKVKVSIAFTTKNIY